MARKKKKDKCELCGRQDTDQTFHHLVPKKLHRKTKVVKSFVNIDLNTHGIMVCSPCHKMIHKKIDHYELATQYYTLEKLKSHEGIAKFISFQQKSHKTKTIK